VLFSGLVKKSPHPLVDPSVPNGEACVHPWNDAIPVRRCKGTKNRVNQALPFESPWKTVEQRWPLVRATLWQ
jgi:hypothetical protein